MRIFDNVMGTAGIEGCLGSTPAYEEEEEKEENEKQ